MTEEYEELVINKIDTDESAERFAKYLKKKRTYFLDGKWGSGKTEFIKKANHHLAGHDIIFVELWRTTDNRSVTELIYSKLHPVKYWLMKYIIFFLVALSILCSDKVNLGLASGHVLLGAVAKIFIWSTTTVVILFQFFKRTSDDIYIEIFKYSKYTINDKILKYSSKKKYINYVLKNKIFKKIFRNKILVVDDFDRVKPDKQEEAYKIFNILNGKLPVLFVGDYEKLVKNEDNYLQKIIDQKISLPYKLHSSEITNGIDLPVSIKQIFTKENRVIRELVHFVDTVNQELKRKAGRVQNEQQLLIIYIYLFHPKIYIALKNGWRPSLSGEKQEGGIFIQQTLILVLKENGNSPRCFSINPESYFIYENATNLSIVELSEIFLTDEKLIMHLNQKDENDKIYEEVSFFIRNMGHNIWEKQAERLEKFAIIQIHNRISPNQLTKYIFQRKLNVLESVLEQGRRYIDANFGNENEFTDYLKEVGIKPRDETPTEAFGGNQEIGEHRV
ncbi:P-loop NTPase fold protein, partial [Lactococcus garvieae]|uniref:P-loop NTPase fold protein n=1 Tax=Lactococcus garvieae TaxID=1363 RepID=UPI00254C820A